jgi:transcription elongation GreA/GreB family factor
MTHNWKIKKQKKISRQIKDIRETGPDTENTDHGSDMGFYEPLVNQSE